jgi:Tol biopolymer transport system component
VLAYRAGAAARRQLVWVDRTGKRLGTLGEVDENVLSGAELAPDGSHVAAYRSIQGNTDVWLIDVRRGVRSRFTFDAATDRLPIWSPDGSRIAFETSRQGADIFEKQVNGAVNERPLVVSPQPKTPLDWSPDGRVLLYASFDSKTQADIWAVSLAGDAKPVPVVQTMFDDVQGQFSHDGQWVVYVSNESGRYEVYVQPFPGGGGKWQVSTAGGVYPRWRRDGREIYYVDPDNRLVAVPIQAAANARTVDVGVPAPLFSTRLAVGANIFTTGINSRTQYAVAADGRFLMNVQADDTAASPITIVQNWTAALKK